MQVKGVEIPDVPSSGGLEYIESCRAEGVPVPDLLFDESDSRWTNAGYLEESITSPKFDTDPERGIELWVFADEAVPGMCLAVKRKWPSPPGSGHFDLICLGVETNKACFFESRDMDNETNLDSAVDISAIDAGETLFSSPCTRCHAGENPFIVHPLDPAFPVQIGEARRTVQHITEFLVGKVFALQGPDHAKRVW